MITVKIDGTETTLLRYDSYSGSRGHQYLTPGNRVSHAFPWRLEGRQGQRFRTGGHDYEIVAAAGSPPCPHCGGTGHAP